MGGREWWHLSVGTRKRDRRGRERLEQLCCWPWAVFPHPPLCGTPPLQMWPAKAPQATTVRGGASRDIKGDESVLGTLRQDEFYIFTAFFRGVDIASLKLALFTTYPIADLMASQAGGRFHRSAELGGLPAC